jgi:lipopolysaccharide heptosyltransferase II
LQTPTHILISRLSSIGDIILTTPVVRVIRNAYPRARISFLVKKEFASLVQYNPHIDNLIVFDKAGGKDSLKQLKERIREENFDWFIDLHNNLRTNYIKRALRFPEVSTYSKQSFRRWLLVKFGKNTFKEAKPVYLKYFDAVRHRDLRYDNKGTEIHFPPAEMENIQKKLISDGIDLSMPVAVICPGASYTNKQWLPDRFGSIADSLIIESKIQLIFLGGPNDSTLCEEIISGMSQQALNYAGQLSLLGSAALLSKADLVISNDSGMMHLAQSQKTPVVAIFGPTTRELGFFPLPAKSAVVQKDVECRPCTTKGLNYCPRKHFNCMKLIIAADVLKAINELSENQET